MTRLMYSPIHVYCGAVVHGTFAEVASIAWQSWAEPQLVSGPDEVEEIEEVRMPDDDDCPDDQPPLNPS